MYTIILHSPFARTYFEQLRRETLFDSMVPGFGRHRMLGSSFSVFGVGTLRGITMTDASGTKRSSVLTNGSGRCVALSELRGALMTLGICGIK